MHVEQHGKTIFITNPNGWDMTEGELLLSLSEAKALRDALDPTITPRETERELDNGEDG